MDLNQKSIGYFIIASSIIWGIVIISCSIRLSGTDCYDKISLILIAGVISHIIFIWGPLATIFKKNPK